MSEFEGMFSAEELNKVGGRFENPDNDLILKIIKVEPGYSTNKHKQLRVWYQCASPGISLGNQINVSYANTVAANWKMKNLALAAGFGDSDGKIVDGFRWRDLENREILADISLQKDSTYLDVTNERPVPSDTPPAEAKTNPPAPDNLPPGEPPPKDADLPF